MDFTIATLSVLAKLGVARPPAVTGAGVAVRGKHSGVITCFNHGLVLDICLFLSKNLC